MSACALIMGYPYATSKPKAADSAAICELTRACVCRHANPKQQKEKIMPDIKHSQTTQLPALSPFVKPYMVPRGVAWQQAYPTILVEADGAVTIMRSPDMEPEKDPYDIEIVESAKAPQEGDFDLVLWDEVNRSEVAREPIFVEPEDFFKKPVPDTLEACLAELADLDRERAELAWRLAHWPEPQASRRLALRDARIAELLRAAAERGDTTAQARLSLAAFTDRRDDEALRWAKAAKAESILARNILTVMGLEGRLPEEAEESALALCPRMPWVLAQPTLQAALHFQSAKGLLGLARSHQKRGGDAHVEWIHRYRKEAFEEMRRAAACGYALAQYHLGKMLREGLGTPCDEAEAKRWFAAAAENGCPLAAAELDR